MTPEQTAVCGIFGLGIAMLVYIAMNNTGDQVVPDVQSEEQTMGLGVQAGLRLNAGTPLDIRPHIHFFDVGYEPPNSCPQPVTLQHRYPAVPGGNISTVMHRGWSAMREGAPADNRWFNTPPEVAVL